MAPPGWEVASSHAELSLEFVTLPLAAQAPAAAGDIAIELRRGAITLKVSWPMAGAASCAAWVREVLR